MLGWLLREGKRAAERTEDSVWLSHAARQRGIARDVERAVSASSQSP
jgi:hypothetical protein